VRSVTLLVVAFDADVSLFARHRRLRGFERVAESAWMRQGITLGDNAFPMLLCLPLALGFLLDDPLFFQLFRYKRRYSKPVKRRCETRGAPRTCGRW
jgi:hypothetical protein